jgi:large subunit ribosomal protein L13
MKSFVAKPKEIERKWYIIDAEGKTLGRLASQVATVLRGKHKPIYTPHVDTGDFVIVINAEKVKLTGKKMNQKVYRHHTGFPGGLKEITAKHLFEKKPTLPLEHAIKGMMPKNTLGREMYKKLKIYSGPNHEHAAQKPEVLDMVK